MSSPLDAPVALISTPPVEAVKTIAEAPFLEDAILTCPVESIFNPLVPESITIPPALVFAISLIALASDSVDNIN